jgi:hypothetical protein
MHNRTVLCNDQDPDACAAIARNIDLNAEALRFQGAEVQRQPAPSIQPPCNRHLILPCALIRSQVRVLPPSDAAEACERLRSEGTRVDVVLRRSPSPNPLSPPPRTKWTRRVPHPVLIGHAASLSQVSSRSRSSSPPYPLLPPFPTPPGLNPDPHAWQIDLDPFGSPVRPCARPTPSPPRTKWTRRVPHPVLIGHAASLTPVLIGHAPARVRPPPAVHRRARARQIALVPAALRCLRDGGLLSLAFFDLATLQAPPTRPPADPLRPEPGPAPPRSGDLRSQKSPPPPPPPSPARPSATGARARQGRAGGESDACFARYGAVPLQLGRCSPEFGLRLALGCVARMALAQARAPTFAAPQPRDRAGAAACDVSS